MPKTTKPATGKTASSKPAAAKSAARNTDSGPSRVSSAGAGDLPTQKMAQVEALVSAMPHNPNKAGEHGFANGLHPQPGATAEPASRLPTGSTLSEEHGSEKTAASRLKV
jgi:catalase